MSRVLTPPLPRVGAADASAESVVDPAVFRPLLRFLVFAIALFVVCAAHVHVGLGVQQARADLDRIASAHKQAALLNDRLHLEIATRSRAMRVEQIATHLEMSPGTRVVRMPEVP